MDAIAATIKIERDETTIGTSEVLEWFESEVDAVQDAAMRNVGNDRDNTVYRAVRTTPTGMFESITGDPLY